MYDSPTSIMEAQRAFQTAFKEVASDFMLDRDKVFDDPDVRKCALDYLYLVYPQKRLYPEFNSVVAENILNNSAFKISSAIDVFQRMVIYTLNLHYCPWEKSYYTIECYTGFFVHKIEGQLQGSRKLFSKIGYKDEGDETLSLAADPMTSYDRMLQHAEHFFLSMVELEIYDKIFSQVCKHGFSLIEVHTCRNKIHGNINECVAYVRTNQMSIGAKPKAPPPAVPKRTDKSVKQNAKELPKQNSKESEVGASVSSTPSCTADSIEGNNTDSVDWRDLGNVVSVSNAAQKLERGLSLNEPSSRPEAGSTSVRALSVDDVMDLDLDLSIKQDERRADTSRATHRVTPPVVSAYNQLPPVPEAPTLPLASRQFKNMKSSSMDMDPPSARNTGSRLSRTPSLEVEQPKATQRSVSPRSRPVPIPTVPYDPTPQPVHSSANVPYSQPQYIQDNEQQFQKSRSNHQPTFSTFWQPGQAQSKSNTSSPDYSMSLGREERTAFSSADTLERKQDKYRPNFDTINSPQQNLALMAKQMYNTSTQSVNTIVGDDDIRRNSWRSGYTNSPRNSMDGSLHSQTESRMTNSNLRNDSRTESMRAPPQYVSSTVPASTYSTTTSPASRGYNTYSGKITLPEQNYETKEYTIRPAYPQGRGRVQHKPLVEVADGEDDLEQINSLQLWQCKKCTFANDVALRECEMCEHPRD